MKLDIRNVYGWRWYLRSDETDRAHAMSCVEFQTKEDAEEHFKNCGFPGVKMVNPEMLANINKSRHKQREDIEKLLHALHDVMNGEKLEEAKSIFDEIKKYYVIHVYGK